MALSWSEQSFLIGKRLRISDTMPDIASSTYYTSVPLYNHFVLVNHFTGFNYVIRGTK